MNGGCGFLLTLFRSIFETEKFEFSINATALSASVSFFRPNLSRRLPSICVSLAEKLSALLVISFVSIVQNS